MSHSDNYIVLNIILIFIIHTFSIYFGVLFALKSNKE